MQRNCPKCGKAQREQSIGGRVSRKCGDCGIVYDGVRYWEVG